ncbi:MAG: type II toxin-antitoxin system RelE/ParE family toxin [Tepidisphaerales bacterium]
MAQVVVTNAATQQIHSLPVAIVDRIADVVVRLARWPAVSGAKPLRHGRKGQYRIRTGDYRVVFEVSGDTVMVVQVGHRKDVYEE